MEWKICDAVVYLSTRAMKNLCAARIYISHDRVMHLHAKAIIIHERCWRLRRPSSSSSTDELRNWNEATWDQEEVHRNWTTAPYISSYFIHVQERESLICRITHMRPINLDFSSADNLENIKGPRRYTRDSRGTAARRIGVEIDDLMSRSWGQRQLFWADAMRHDLEAFDASAGLGIRPWKVTII